MIFFFFLIIFSCNKSEDENCSNGEKGEIVLNPFDCDKDLIRLDSGSFLQISNLKEYDDDTEIGTKVQISYEESEIFANTCMNGNIVILTCYIEI